LRLQHEHYVSPDAQYNGAAIIASGDGLPRLFRPPDSGQVRAQGLYGATDARGAEHHAPSPGPATGFFRTQRTNLRRVHAGVYAVGISTEEMPAKLRLQVASHCHAGACCNRWTIVIDDDHPSNINDVIWAMCTRLRWQVDIIHGGARPDVLRCAKSLTKFAG
jgi:hypothetical protein